MSNSHEPLYSQEDVDVVLKQLQKTQRSEELSNHLLWAAVQAAGGEIVVPMLSWADGLPEGDLEFIDDPETSTMRLRIVKKE